jgi:signal transduction histidine kinase
MKNKILCVDDEIDNLDALERLLRKPYSFLKAKSGKEALQLLDQNPDIAVIISDQRMPEMTGVELLELSIKTHPESTRLLLTGYTDIESVIEAVNKGNIFRYITKPWDSADLTNTVKQAAEKYNLVKEIKQKNKELSQALEELKSLDTAKSKFMILINHELKTPLTVILNYLELLKEQTQDPALLNFIAKSNISALRLKEIIEDVLLIMRGETNQLKLEKEQLHLDKIITAVFSEFTAEANKKQITLEIQTSPQKIIVNKKFIEKICRELIKNAIQWGISCSKIQVILRTNGAHMDCSFENQGPQLNQEIIVKIHQPFKLPENIMNHSKGLGLGLSIIETLLRVHHSQLSVENLPAGVRFNFKLEIKS